ncbi:hypothetical protein ACLIYP_02180 [Streptomyces nanhaiensis]|uniref:hypothetical protein n=1 Tax=Streptomyces nanhaiensis TaxID=679319 RepID=UPI00399D0F69
MIDRKAPSDDLKQQAKAVETDLGHRQTEQGEHGLTDDDLRNRRLRATTRGRRAAEKK